MNLDSLRNPRFASVEQDAILFDMKMEDGTIAPFVARLSDPYGIGAEAFQAAMGGRFGAIGPYVTPEQPPLPPIEITADVLFFDRMTDDEYDALDASIRAGETARVYRGWTAATSFTEGSAMWTLLDKHLSLVVTAERKAELLARPVLVAAASADDEVLVA